MISRKTKLIYNVVVKMIDFNSNKNKIKMTDQKTKTKTIFVTKIITPSNSFRK